MVDMWRAGIALERRHGLLVGHTTCCRTHVRQLLHHTSTPRRTPRHATPCDMPVESVCQQETRGWVTCLLMRGRGGTQ